jgi:hypothetical protein
MRCALASVLLLGLTTPLAPTAMARSPGGLQALKGALDAAASQIKQGATQAGQRPANAAAPAPRGPAISGDCCSAEAMKRQAAALSGLDVAGVKLGMTPEQAFAAVQAFNPKMTVQANKTSYYVMPTDSPTRQIPAPWYAVAHTPGRGSSFMAADNSSDQILIEFSTPPSAPMVVRVIRYVSFPNGQPLVSATLSDSLVKKYGAISEHGPALVWVYDAQGRHVAGAAEPFCSSAGYAYYEAPGGQPPYSQGTVTGVVSVPQQDFADSEIDRTNSRYFLKSCHHLGAVVVARPGDDMGRDFKIVQMTQVLSSPALLYASRKNAQDWLDAKIAAYRGQRDNAARNRAAPKL